MVSGQSHWWFYYAERGEGILPDRHRQWELMRELNDRLAALEATKQRKPRQPASATLAGGVH